MKWRVNEGHYNLLCWVGQSVFFGAHRRLVLRQVCKIRVWKHYWLVGIKLCYKLASTSEDRYPRKVFIQV